MFRNILISVTVLIASTAYAEEWREVSVPKSIPVNRSSEFLSADLVDTIHDLNLKLRDSGSNFSLPFNGEILKDGKLFSAEDFAAMSDLGDVSSILNSDHCEFSDAVPLYKKGMLRKGHLLLHVYNTTPLNVMTFGSSTNGVVTRITQILAREYFVVESQSKNDPLAMIRCYTVLESRSGEEAVEKERAYEAEGAYAPLIRHLGQ